MADRKSLPRYGSVTLVVSEPVPDEELMDQFDHDKLDVYKAAIQ